ncbi:MAG: biotin--[acetyl-CoA-carboxylase] ligase [Pseudomonadota bacterium]|nr:biotin--[acetyl-CoA-carboxylase] ligase [Pseudomonadota bacterium]
MAESWSMNFGKITTPNFRVSKSLPGFINIIRKEITGSTNEDIALLAKQNAEAWTVVQALEQNSGRGRHGKTWDSQRGNLFMSLLLRPAVGSGRWGELSFLSAVAVATILSEYINSQKIEVKWPNDVLINGKKIAGILLEVLNFGAKAPAVVMGIGINISKKPKEFEYPVTCIQDYKNEITSSDEVLTSLLHSIVHWFRIWENDGFDLIRTEWMKRAYKLDGTVEVEGKNGSSAKFKFKGIDAEGAMLLDDENGTRNLYRAGTVRFL